eukprot:14079106-Ditylum_brightwellii.AAC.1
MNFLGVNEEGDKTLDEKGFDRGGNGHDSDGNRHDGDGDKHGGDRHSGDRHGGDGSHSTPHSLRH